MRTQVAIIGAGPAGLTLAHMLHHHGIDSVVLELRSEEHVRTRVRAGVLEQTTVDVLTDIGVGARLHRDALVHDGFYVRLDGRTHHLDFHTLTGRHAYVYGQAEVVADLLDARRATGRPTLFEATDVRIDGFADGTPTVEFTHAGRTEVLHADVIAGCDGAHGASRAAVADRLGTGLAVLERTYPFAWLGILARTAPVTEEGLYSVHPTGLSVHSMRGRAVTRQYLQVPADTRLADWPDERIWKELRHRSRADDHPPLAVGEIVERSITPLRGMVTDPMQAGSLFLLGDAAHVVPPTGAKGLNLAISDACVLSHALGGFYASGDRTALDDYTRTALPRTWQAQAFSWTMTSTLHTFDPDPYDWELRRARIHRWVDSEAERRALGEVYLGLPFPTPWRPRG